MHAGLPQQCINNLINAQAPLALAGTVWFHSVW